MRRILLLSSTKFLFDNPPKVFQKYFDEMKMAYIITASKGVVDKNYFNRNRNFFRENNFLFEEVDLDRENEASLKKKLSEFEIIFVEGGNTFYLLESIRRSGFNNIIEDLLDKGIIYIGASAGSYVACPTIEMATWKHQDKYHDLSTTDLSAMNLVPFLVTAHYKLEYKELLSEKIKCAQHQVKILTDEQAILVSDGKTRLIGSGEEVQL